MGVSYPYPTRVVCRCGNATWKVYRGNVLNDKSSELYGTDAALRCTSCGLWARSDGKTFDPEGRLTP